AGRTDTEGDDVLADGVDVPLLARRLRPDRATLGAAEHLVREDLARSLGRAHHLDRTPHTRDVERLPLLQQEHELFEQPGDLLGLVALDGDLRAAHEDVGVGKGSLNEPEELIAVAEQASHEVVPWNADVDLGDAHAGTCDLTRLGTARGYRT